METFKTLWAGVKVGDTGALMTALGLFLAVMLIVAIAVNMRVSRRNRDAPAPKWGKNSSRFRK